MNDLPPIGEIVPGVLYVGTKEHAADADLLREVGLSHVMYLADHAMSPHPALVTYNHIMVDAPVTDAMEVEHVPAIPIKTCAAYISKTMRLGDKVLVHGGCTSRGPGSPAILLNDCHVLTVQCRGAAWTSSVKIESRWDAIANATGAKPSPRSNHTAVHVPDGDFGDDLERRLGDEASGAMRIPDARHGGGVVYVFGGAVNVNKTDRSRALVDVSDDLFAYDVDDRRWSKLRRPYVTSGKSKAWPSARCGHR